MSKKEQNRSRNHGRYQSERHKTPPDGVMLLRFFLQRLHLEWSGGGATRPICQERWKTVLERQVDVNRSATLEQIREAIREQHPDVPVGYIFYHVSQGTNIEGKACVVTQKQEGRQSRRDRKRTQTHRSQTELRRLDHGSGFLRARDFYSLKQLLLRIPGYIEGEQLPEEESNRLEFKSLAAKLEHDPKATKLHEEAHQLGTPAAREKAVDADSALALRTVSDYLQKYVNAFLNTEGGAIYFGVEDKDRTVRATVTPGRDVFGNVTDPADPTSLPYSPSIRVASDDNIDDDDELLRDTGAKTFGADEVMNDRQRSVLEHIDEQTRPARYVLFSDKELDSVLLKVDSFLKEMDPLPDPNLVHVKAIPIIIKGVFDAEIIGGVGGAAANPESRAAFVVRRRPYVLQVHVNKGTSPVTFLNRDSGDAFLRLTSSILRMENHQIEQRRRDHELQLQQRQQHQQRLFSQSQRSPQLKVERVWNGENIVKGSNAISISPDDLSLIDMPERLERSHTVLYGWRHLASTVEKFNFEGACSQWQVRREGWLGRDWLLRRLLRVPDDTNDTRRVAAIEDAPSGNVAKPMPPSPPVLPPSSLKPRRRGKLVLIVGGPGTGKSCLCRHLTIAGSGASGGGWCNKRMVAILSEAKGQCFGQSISAEANCSSIATPITDRRRPKKNHEVTTSTTPPPAKLEVLAWHFFQREEEGAKDKRNAAPFLVRNFAAQLLESTDTSAGGSSGLSSGSNHGVAFRDLRRRFRSRLAQQSAATHALTTSQCARDPKGALRRGFLEPLEEAMRDHINDKFASKKLLQKDQRRDYYLSGISSGSQRSGKKSLHDYEKRENDDDAPIKRIDELSKESLDSIELSEAEFQSRCTERNLAIVIDGLDIPGRSSNQIENTDNASCTETEEQTGTTAADIVLELAEKLPPWLCLIVTTRKPELPSKGKEACDLPEGNLSYSSWSRSLCELYRIAQQPGNDFIDLDGTRILHPDIKNIADADLHTSSSAIGRDLEAYLLHWLEERTPTAGKDERLRQKRVVAQVAPNLHGSYNQADEHVSRIARICAYHPVTSLSQDSILSSGKGAETKCDATFDEIQMIESLAKTPTFERQSSDDLKSIAAEVMPSSPTSSNDDGVTDCIADELLRARLLSVLLAACNPFPYTACSKGSEPAVLNAAEVTLIVGARSQNTVKAMLASMAPRVVFTGGARALPSFLQSIAARRNDSNPDCKSATSNEDQDSASDVSSFTKKIDAEYDSYHQGYTLQGSSWSATLISPQSPGRQESATSSKYSEDDNLRSGNEVVRDAAVSLSLGHWLIAKTLLDGILLEVAKERTIRQRQRLKNALNSYCLPFPTAAMNNGLQQQGETDFRSPKFASTIFSVALHLALSRSKSPHGKKSKVYKECDRDEKDGGDNDEDDGDDSKTDAEADEEDAWFEEAARLLRLTEVYIDSIEVTQLPDFGGCALQSLFDSDPRFDEEERLTKGETPGICAERTKIGTAKDYDQNYEVEEFATLESRAALRRRKRWHGITALHLAILYRQPGAIALLLKANADPNAPLLVMPKPIEMQSVEHSLSTSSSLTPSSSQRNLDFEVSTNSAENRDDSVPSRAVNGHAAWSPLELACASGEITSAKLLLVRDDGSRRWGFSATALLRCVAGQGLDRILDEVVLPMMIEHDIDNNERLPAPSDIREYFESPSIVNDRIEWAIRGHRDEFADILRSAWVIARQHRYLQRQLPILSVCVWSAAARGWSRAVAVCLRWGKTCRDICLQSVLHECRKASNILVSEVNAGVVDNDLKEMFLTRCLDLVVPHLAAHSQIQPQAQESVRSLEAESFCGADCIADQTSIHDAASAGSIRCCSILIESLLPRPYDNGSPDGDIEGKRDIGNIEETSTHSKVNSKLEDVLCSIRSLREVEEKFASFSISLSFFSPLGGLRAVLLSRLPDSQRTPMHLVALSGSLDSCGRGLARIYGTVFDGVANDRTALQVFEAARLEQENTAAKNIAFEEPLLKDLLSLPLAALPTAKSTVLSKLKDRDGRSPLDLLLN